MHPARDVPRSMLHVLRSQAERLNDKPALWTKREGRYRPTSWRAYHARVRQLAFGLRRLGLKRGEALGILSFNREEWLLSELAAMGLGGVAVGLYTTASAEQLQYILAHCEARIVVAENAAHLETIRSIRAGLPKLQHVILLEGASIPSEQVIAFEEVMAFGEHADFAEWDRSVDALQPDELATLIYTSGTTGEPKGVMLSHRNLCWTTVQLCRSAVFDPEGVIVSYLPLSHIAEQICTIHGPLVAGLQVYFAESMERLPEALSVARPTVFLGVPRVWEKLKARVEENLGKQSPRRQQLIGWAREVAKDWNERTLRCERPPIRLEAQYQLARRLVFGPLKERIGMDRVRFFATAAAPISREVLEFFESLDIVIREVYGQSEVTGPTTVSTPEHTRLGVVGRPMLGVEVRIADDGEILVRGENVCLGYFKDPAATTELLEGGWLHSGDVGELDDQGYLRITGRKKELIVTSGGKKTAPLFIESRLKEIRPLGNALVIGERRNHLVALLALDPEQVPAFAREHGLPEDPEQLARDPDFRRYLDEQLQSRVNRQLARFEQVRKYAVLPHDFTTEGGELTPTLKVRRKAVEEKYRALIDALYAADEDKTKPLAPDGERGLG